MRIASVFLLSLEISCLALAADLDKTAPVTAVVFDTQSGSEIEKHPAPRSRDPSESRGANHICHNSTQCEKMHR